MLNNVDKFTDWLFMNRPFLFFMLCFLTLCLIGGFIFTALTFFPYALSLIPITISYYIIHFYRKGDWK